MNTNCADRVMLTVGGNLHRISDLILDRRTGERVYLLDEVCELAPRDRVSPGLVEAVAMLGVNGPSYRIAEGALKSLYGERAVSHETIRNVLQRVGERLRLQKAKQRGMLAGTRKVPVLFIETDGLCAHLQREMTSLKEVHIAVSHEGWKPRHPSSKEYRLINKLYFTWDGKAGDFWEEYSRFLAAHYDLENTLVVINGDRASWIRKGVEWFPRAIYQFDRFHILRDVRSLLRGQPDRLKTAMDAFKASDEGLFLATLAQAFAQEKDPGRQQQLEALTKDLADIPEFLRDYRVRLRQEYNMDTSGYRGLGAAESQMDRYARRLKKRGQSWGTAGLGNMLAALTAKFEGRLIETVQSLGRHEEPLPQLRQRLSAGWITAKSDPTLEPRSAGFPATIRGLNATGGLARIMRHISHPSVSTI